MQNNSNYQPPDLDDLLDDYSPPDAYSPQPRILTPEEISEMGRENYRKNKDKILRASRKAQLKRAREREREERIMQEEYRKMQDYSEENRTFMDPARPEDRMNPYDYGSRPMSRHDEPQDITPAAEEFKGVVDLFDPNLFPAQNSKKYSDKTGREFLADFTKATRGQLVVSMARLAQENPKEFAKMWVEMEKFNTPQQSAVDVNADVKLKAGLYAKLDEMSGPVDGEALEMKPEGPLQLDENGNEIIEEAEYDDLNDSAGDDEDTEDDIDDLHCPCTSLDFCRKQCAKFNHETNTCTDEYPSQVLFPLAVNEGETGESLQAGDVKEEFEE